MRVNITRRNCTLLFGSNSAATISANANAVRVYDAATTVRGCAAFQRRQARRGRRNGRTARRSTCPNPGGRSGWAVGFLGGLGSLGGFGGLAGLGGLGLIARF
ncbi:hypothetical protein GCM10020256_52860 [Streptomyces thermocoprophilus]